MVKALEVGAEHGVEGLVGADAAEMQDGAAALGEMQQVDALGEIHALEARPLGQRVRKGRDIGQAKRPAALGQPAGASVTAVEDPAVGAPISVIQTRRPASPLATMVARIPSSMICQPFQLSEAEGR